MRRFVDGEASDDDLVVLGSLAPTDEARVFVAQAASLGPAPTGNLYALLAYARDLAARAPELQRLLPVAARSVEAFDRPLLVAVMGEFNAGKSSFVNAFCGQEVAPVGVTPTTATINVLRYGPPGGRVLYHDGQVRELGALEVAPFLRDLGEEAAAVRTVEIFFPLDVLRRVEIVDTPGLNSLRTEHEKVARAFLTEADAIVWLFAVGQAAKATERDALGLAHAAGKRVLGVLNKADQASTEELAGVVRHVQQGLGDRIEALLPLSARLALQGRPEASGLPAVLQALEERFFGHARTLKRRTALAALTRFGGEARALLPDEDPDPAPARLRALDAAEQTLRGALAAERVGLRGRLEHAFRHAAGEVLEFVGPRRWPFGEARAAAADEEFLFDFLEDALGQATDVTRAALEEAAAAGPPVPIVAAVERFRAYGRGVLAGGLVERTLREELSTAGPGRERASVERALMRHLPDVDGELLTPLAAEVTSVYARARVACDEESRRLAMRRMLRAERLDRPLAALEVAVAAIEKN